ncbi:chromophore lyase CpcT/CpeT [Flavobacterium litorale]|uniref:Chromophore lyase CpcT/CpeT n=1 Tax=Flavobacterium litorale TaxID=2856519 RepID=A0ABX8V480_9FLAO|nr:chromophore lyase CpcT/CpeT [Flavobacterium litorale]QYJ67635.1 chromophore lyase CpcT/CpeT [Flavobacterium litorale]
MKKIYFTLLIGLTVFSGIAQNTSNKNEKHLKELLTIMQGNYTSEKQSVADTTYYNISLRMVPIWENREGNYIYVEQALYTKQDKPYRVRIYKVSHYGNDAFISDIYTIKNEKEWIGKWGTPEAFDALPLTNITLKEGCGVVLKRVAKNKFVGATGEKTCKSELYGASYATSEVTVLPNQIISWDRGFDDDDEHVWGAEKAGYIFDKL